MHVLETAAKYSVFADLSDFSIKSLTNSKVPLPEVKAKVDWIC